MSNSAIVTSMRARSRQPPQNRRVVINHKEVVIEGDVVQETKGLPNNRVVTSKYTVLNFIPKNLFEQFRRIANFYFLCIAIIQVTTNSPVSPITSLAPLIFVVVTTALKQAYEDWLRHKTDRATNNRMIPILKNGGIIQVKSEDIRVGDIVMVKCDEEIPCDMVLISTTSSNHQCHVTTANLDGETNLKTRDCLESTKQLTTDSELDSINGMIECEKPNTDLYEFVGNMKLLNATDVQTFHLGPSNLLIRGSRLRNTPSAFGVAVYTGQETKLALNSRLTSNKFSTIEKTANRYLIAYLFILIIISTICLIFRIVNVNNPSQGSPWYILGPGESAMKLTAVNIFKEFLAFFVIFNYLIPISLYVTLEMVKFFGSKTLVNDPKLVDPESLERPKCNSSDLNEDLGQVEYLFSDKTGTLTENMMLFTSCSVNGTIYDEKDGHLVTKPAEGTSSGAEPIKAINGDLENFLLAIAVCNTVQVEKKDHQEKDHQERDHQERDPIKDEEETLTYAADSPDEKALVEACNRFGICVIDSSEKTSDIKIGDRVRKYKKLQIFQFDSSRKRMSVIVEDEEGNISLVCKGADSEMRRLLATGKVNETYQHIDEYAGHGLRTLVVASRSVSKDEYESSKKEIEVARQSMENRKEAVSKAQAKMEKNLNLLGATAVEDRLQDGVAETIEDLKKAGIKVWVLTGDKLETAVSVAYSCGLIDNTMTRLHLSRQSNPDACGETVSRYATVVQDSDATNDSGQKCALIVDGRSLHFAMKFHMDKFRQLCERCLIVLCCRMSPIQKAEVVHMIKVSKKAPVTAAIGDGANDVSMIQEAHVGFGLMGKEGRQAVNAADFAFARFRFLKRVLLVHGNLFYNRVSTLIHYFFYKNVAFVTPQFLYSFYNAFSSQTLYHGMLLMLFNMMFTASPIVVYGIVEKHIPIRSLETEASLYRKIRRNRNMRFSMFLVWFFNGLIHGLILFYFFYAVWQTSIWSDGKSIGLFAFGLCIYHGVILTVTFKLGIIARYWNFYFGFAMLLSIFCVLTFCSVYTSYKWTILNDDLYGTYDELLKSLNFWSSIALAPLLTLLPDLVKVILQNSIPSNFWSKKKLTANVSPQGEEQDAENQRY